MRRRDGASLCKYLLTEVGSAFSACFPRRAKGRVCNPVAEQMPYASNIMRRRAVVLEDSWVFDGLRSDPCKDLIGRIDHPDPGARTDGDLCPKAAYGNKDS